MQLQVLEGELAADGDDRPLGELPSDGRAVARAPSVTENALTAVLERVLLDGLMHARVEDLDDLSIDFNCMRNERRARKHPSD